MSRSVLVGGVPVFVIEREPDRDCELCGIRSECRPYGPGGKQICHPCMTSTPELRATAEAAIAQRMGVKRSS